MIGILADIHANLEALEAVLAEAPPCERWICLGDLVGYGPNPNECCERVRKLDAVCLMGNHDAASIGRLDLDWFRDAARESIVWTREQLRSEHRRYLESFADRLTLDDLTLVHGSLVAPLVKYVSSELDAEAILDRMNTAICLIGHTHAAEYFARIGNSPCSRRHGMARGGAIALEVGTCYVVNCGSVGQPRDGNPQASYGVYDATRRELAIHRVAYPYRVTQDKVKRAGLPAWLGQRLAEGR